LREEIVTKAFAIETEGVNLRPLREVTVAVAQLSRNEKSLIPKRIKPV
jgi:hypothetical protein